MNVRTVALVVCCAVGAAGQSDNSAREKLIESLNSLARTQLEARATAIAKIQTRADAERRKETARRKIVELMGGPFLTPPSRAGLAEHRGAVAVKQFGILEESGFRIEKLAYESLPGFWVTANLYVPASGGGPFPAVLLTPGHEATGKLSQYSFGANFARSGIIALAIDPLGQGERLQYFDPAQKKSIIGGSTGEHGEANVPAMLIGEDIARYFINDGMRGIDYLIGRPDVDANRIGALGCSGGGTATAYLAAPDDRVKVAGVACYITSFQELLPSATGVQEAEQSIPRFIEQGLDFADWVELFAPKPYAIISTTNDMFPFQGAHQTFEETKRFYSIYGAQDNIQWITGPGGHGNLGPISPAILGFFLHHLKGAPAGDASFTTMRPARPEDLLCTPTGQISTELGAETIASIVQVHARELLPVKRPLSSKAELQRLQSRLRQDIRALASVSARPGSGPPAVRIVSREPRDGYRMDVIAIPSVIPSATPSTVAELPGLIAVPNRGRRKPAMLIVDSQPVAKMLASSEVDRLAKEGNVVMAFEPTPAPPGTEGLKSPYLGSFNLLSLRASLVGKTIPGIRIDDVIHAVDWLVSLADVDSSKLTVYGDGPMGPVVLHAAALDQRMQRIVLENSLAAYRMAVEQPLHRNMPEVLIPGVLRRYDLGDLLLALSPRAVTLVNPQDATGTALADDQFRKALDYVFQSEAMLGTPQRIRVVSRAAGERLPLE
jgi:cephalosporin-C deacetylase-like acetyl esterase